MKPATYLLVLLLGVDTIAWAYFYGFFASLFWVCAALGVIAGHRWLDRQDCRIPTYRIRRRMA
jgi:hypothetical protein